MYVYIYTCIYVYYLYTYVYVLIYIYIYYLHVYICISWYIQTYLQYCIQTLYMSDSIGIIRSTLVLFQTLFFGNTSSSPIATSVQEVSLPRRAACVAPCPPGVSKAPIGTGAGQLQAGTVRGRWSWWVSKWGLKNHETKRKNKTDFFSWSKDIMMNFMKSFVGLFEHGRTWVRSITLGGALFFFFRKTHVPWCHGSERGRPKASKIGQDWTSDPSFEPRGSPWNHQMVFLLCGMFPNLVTVIRPKCDTIQSWVQHWPFLRSPSVSHLT